MTFKAHWEKTSSRINLPQELILSMLRTYYTSDNDIKSVSIISGGCANINILAELNISDSPVILRVYLRDKDSAYREQKISSLLSKKLPVPAFYHVGQYDGYTFALVEYLAGQTLRDFLLECQRPNIGDIMFKVGKSLGEISNIKFPMSGFFDEELEIKHITTPESLLQFCDDCLGNKNVKGSLPQNQRNQLKNVFVAYKNLLIERCERNLVHADFDPANILVIEGAEGIELSGILDWEFSFSGSTLWDVASMIRYAHQMPHEYQSSFLHGLSSNGYILPSSWEKTVCLLNIISMLDCLARSDSQNRPHQIQDIQELISHNLEVFSKIG